MNGLAESAQGTKPTDLAPGTAAPPPAPEPIPTNVTAPKPAFDPAQAQPVQASAPTAGAKPPFDPSQATPVTQDSKPPFDPDQATPVTPDHPLTSWLPMAGNIIGGIGGGIAGSPTGPGALASEVGGSALGAGAGSVLKDKLNNWLYSETKSNEDIAKDAGKEAAVAGVTQGVGGLAFRGAAKAGGALLDTAAGQAVKGFVQPALDAAGNLIAKGTEAVTGVPAQIIKKYSQAAEVIAKMSKDADGDIAVASDAIKKTYMESIKETGATLQSQIDQKLTDSTERIDPSPILREIDKMKSTIDMDAPNGKELMGQLNEMSSYVVKKKDENGFIFAKDANGMKKYFQSLAEYEGPATQVEKAAMKAGAVTRGLINEAVPEVAPIQQQQALLIRIQQKMNKGLITQGSSESPLIAAGKYAPGSAEGNARNALALSRLGKLTGTDMLTPAQNLAVMKVLGNASLKGKGIGVALGGAAGAAAGYETGIPGGAYTGAGVGAAIGGAGTSPLALKTMIDVGRKYGLPAATALTDHLVGNQIIPGKP